MAAKKRSSTTPNRVSRSEALPSESKKGIAGRNQQEIIALICGGASLLHLLALISYVPADLPSWVPFAPQGGETREMQNFAGPLGALLAGYSYFFLGAAAYLLPVLLLWLGFGRLLGFPVSWNRRTLLSGATLVLAMACLVDLQDLFFQSWIWDYQLPRSKGGLAGFVLSQSFLGRFLGQIGAGLVVLVIYLISLILLTGFQPIHFAEAIRKLVVGQLGRVGDFWPKTESPENQTNTQESASGDVEPPPVEEAGRPEPKIIDANAQKPSPAGKPTNKLAFDLAHSVRFKNYRLPQLDLLDVPTPISSEADKDELIRVQRVIIDTLATFKLQVSPGDITRGPTITRYEVYPRAGLSVKKIASFEADLARATRAERINILAPIPGKDTVGIEIANSRKVLVPLRELLEDAAFSAGKAQIPLALGKDVYGRGLVADLAAMPHLLVAGATGSGKSVCINSIITSLLFRFSPEELRFIMIDPKVVEMQVYNTLPHLAVPVVTDPKKVLLALRWCLNEMERRYALFAEKGVRKLEEYNAVSSERLTVNRGSAPAPSAEDEDAFFLPQGAVAHAVRVEKTEPQEEMEALPYIVVIIDELADLMQTASSEVEVAISRLCQKARASGIHLVVATQSPRADVVTGLIKANIPSRIAFQVSSTTDSRVILDKGGAEKLVGKGDFLFQPPDSAVFVRAQGAFLTDGEVNAVIRHCSSQAKPDFDSEIEEILMASGDDEPGGDSLSSADQAVLDQCVDLIMTERKASTSFLQRRLRLGYTRAARMMDLLEERGIVGPGDGAKPREILVES